MDKKTKKSLQDAFKRGKLGWKIIWSTLIFLILFVSIFSPFMLVEGANKTLGIVLLCILGFVYAIILLIFIWDWLKEKVSDDQKNIK